MTSLRRLGLPTGLALGAAGLAAVAAFAVLLPEAQGEDSASSASSGAAVELPDTLPGEWTAVDLASAADGADGAGAEQLASRKAAVDYVNDVYADVYDEPVAFRVYSDQELAQFVIVTVFSGEGGAFGPPNGLADPEAQQLARASTELVRVDDAVCVANYEPVPAGQDAEGAPLAVTCQLPADGHTVQVATNEQSVDDTVALAHDVADGL